jgi:Ran GTPase-activating protein (RanGAP) involved in mRNA processing and transport
MSRLQVWKLHDNDTAPTTGNNTNTNTNTSMILNGSSMDETAIETCIYKAKMDLNCNELDIRDLECDFDQCVDLIDLIQSKSRKQEQAPWKSIHMFHCTGHVQDLVMAIMSLDVNAGGVQNFQLTHPSSILSSHAIYGIAYGLNYSTSLTELSLQIPITQEASNLLSRALAKNAMLTSLSLHGCTLEDAAVPPLSFALKLNGHLQTLSLDGCGLSDEHIASILTALQHHPSLHTLSLQQNSCHTLGMAAIAALLHLDQLKDLDLSYLTRQKATKKVEPVPSPPQQEEVVVEDDTKDANDNDADDESKDTAQDETKVDVQPKKAASKPESSNGDAQEQDDDDSKQAVRNTSLQVLQLAGNNLNDAYLSTLLPIFGKSSQLQELNLFGNRITDRGVLQALINKLPLLNHLESLWLGHNSLTATSAKLLAEAMHTNYNLMDVNLRTLAIMGRNHNHNTIQEERMDAYQDELDYYCRLNRGGRRIFGSSNEIPLGLWPLVLERANRIYWGASTGNTDTHNQEKASHAADVVYCLLHGPMLFTNPDFANNNDDENQSSSFPPDTTSNRNHSDGVKPKRTTRGGKKKNKKNKNN